MAHLVFQTAFPGDLFLSIPLLKSIKSWDPGEPLALACRPGLGEFFNKMGLVDEVIEIDKGTGAGRQRALARIRGRDDWEVLFVPHESLRTALWMSRTKARRMKVGFRKWWNGAVYGKRIVKSVELPEALRQLSLLSVLDDDLARRLNSEEMEPLKNTGLQTSPLLLSLPKIPEWASMKLRNNRPSGRRVFLAPGSMWATKRWTRSGYTELARILLARDFRVELVGSAAEKILCDEIERDVTGLVNHAGKTSLNDLVELLESGTALVCNDSGAMHAASVVDLPTVAIFGPTVLVQGFRPWQNRTIVVQRELGCRPCGRHGAAVCPIGTHECMKAITARDVMAAFDLLLGDSSVTDPTSITP